MYRRQGVIRDRDEAKGIERTRKMQEMREPREKMESLRWNRRAFVAVTMLGSSIKS